MSEMKWTPQQEAAISHSGGMLLVSAAAGSGKTSVLVERVLRRIIDPGEDCNIDDFLIVTFSQAAATDMRRKIVRKITEAIGLQPGNKKLVRQIGRIDGSFIMTLHAFCLAVIRNNFNLTDLDPGFRICDDPESALIKADAIDALFDEILEQDDFDAEFQLLNDWYGSGRKEEKLKEFLLGLYSGIESQPDPFVWLDEKAGKFDPAKTGSDWEPILIRQIMRNIGWMADRMANASDAIQKDPGASPNHEAFRTEQAMLAGLHAGLLQEDLSWDALPEKIGNFAWTERLKQMPLADAKIKDFAIAIRKECKEEWKEIRERVDGFRKADADADSEKIRRVFAKIAILLKRFEELYSKRKRDRAAIDFNDIEHYCLRILRDDSGGPSPAALEYARRFREVIIDEYQDINLTQDAILRCLGSNVFMVGDVKQSIYRFRDACPDLFMDKYGTYGDDLSHRAPHAGDDRKKILLNANFRSRPEIIDTVNHLFHQIMSASTAEIDYTDKEELKFRADFDCRKMPVELHILDHATIRETLADDPGKTAIEARYLAARIKSLMRSDLGIRYRDIVVLMRATKGKNDIFQREFAAAGIPSYVDDAKGFFQSIEIQIVMSLLAIVDNPMQDIPLLAVLRSPIGGFASEELAKIRISGGAGRFYSAMRNLSDGDAALNEKAAGFLRDLSKWREWAAMLPVSDLLRRLYAETLYYDYAGAMSAGEQRQGNLQILFEKAVQFEKTGYKGLFHFNRFISRIREGSSDFGSARTFSEKDDVVRIMSIHKSKGLEFKAVILADCCKGFNLNDSKESVLIHRELGFGPEVVDRDMRIKYPSAQKLAVKEKIRAENIAEEMRILYVGLTRAQEKLIISGICDNFGEKRRKWTDAPSFAKAAAAGSFMQWICMGLGTHKDACVLRGETSVEDPEASLRVSVITADDFSLNAEPVQTFEIDGEPDIETAGDPEYAEIARRLEWKYPDAASVRLPVKIPVSEYSKRMVSAESPDDIRIQCDPVAIVRAPAFLEAGGIETASRLGTLTHYILQTAVLDGREITADQIEGQMESMIRKGFLAQEESGMIDPEEITAFFRTPIGTRLRNAPKAGVFREMPFVLAVDASLVYEHQDLPDGAGGYEILVQGVIDCFFTDAGGSVLLDYKTDHVRGFDADMVREKYATQIDLYKRAIHEKTNGQPFASYIYMLKNGVFIPV